MLNLLYQIKQMFGTIKISNLSRKVGLMSLFDFFKKKATNATPEPAPVTDDTPITWENTTDPDDFFEGYQAAVQALTDAGKHAAAETLRADAGKHAAAETLRANEPALQLAFIERFEVKTRADIANIRDLDARTAAVIDAVSTVRRYSRHMSVAVRARLAQAKKNLIGE